jgi:hypothetical protein
LHVDNPEQTHAAAPVVTRHTNVIRTYIKTFVTKGRISRLPKIAVNFFTRAWTPD